jgi:hypothetical protein
VQQLACRDISVRLRTARVLQSVAQHELPDEYFKDEVCFARSGSKLRLACTTLIDRLRVPLQEIMKHVQLALREDFIENDELIEYALLKYSLRASAGKGHCASLARGGLVDMFLAKLADQVMNLKHIFLIMQILSNLAREDDNHELFLEDDGFISIASKTVFRDLPHRRKETIATRSYYVKKSKRTT